MSFEEISFGTCVQCFHQGDYNLINNTTHLMREFAASLGYKYELFTHDIYLNDLRKTKTRILATIMRIMVSK